MLPLLNHAVAMTLALALILAVLVSPLLVGWILFSITRDFRRIANALEKLSPRDIPSTPSEQVHPALQADQTPRRIAHSAFGR